MIVAVLIAEIAFGFRFSSVGTCTRSGLGILRAADKDGNEEAKEKKPNSKCLVKSLQLVRKIKNRSSSSNLKK